MNEKAKAQIDENFGDIVYAHVPLSVFTGVFTWIFWPIKFFAYLFDEESVKSAQMKDGMGKSGDMKEGEKPARRQRNGQKEDGEKDGKKGSGKGGDSDLKWWFDW